MKNCLLDEIKHNYLMREDNKKTCKCLNYVKHLLILVSTVNGYVSISVGITSSAVRINICAITARIKKYK